VTLSRITAARRPATDPKRIRQAIRKLADLPSSLPAIQRAIAATEKPESTNEEIHQVLAVDPALTARILRVANSPYFGVMGQVRTVSMAVALMGRDRLRALLRHVQVAELYRCLSGRGPATERLWEKAVAAAAATGQLAQGRYSGDLEEASIAAFFHNIGELVLCLEFREEYESALRRAESMPRRQALAGVFGVDFSVVGGWLLETWNFPALLVRAVESWEDPLRPSFEAALRERLCLVQAGVRVAEAWSRQLGPQAATAGMLTEVLKTLRLDPPAVEAVYQDLPRHIARYRELWRG